jgi:hypothetical protein
MLSSTGRRGKMTRQQAIEELSSQRNVPDELYDFQEAKNSAEEFVSTLESFPDNAETLLDMQIAYQVRKLGL